MESMIGFALRLMARPDHLRYGNTALPLHLDVFHIDDQRHPLETSIGTARDAWVAVRGEESTY